MAQRATPCVFCGLRNGSDVGRCAGCGGPLQAPVGADPGDPPPPAPRAIARQWVWAEVYQFPIVWGLAFGGGGSGIGCGVGAILTVAFLASGLLPALPMIWMICGFLVLIFGGIGGVVFVAGVRSGLAQLRLLRDGRPAVAKVVAVQLDTSVRRDGMHPWTVQYVFDVGESPFGGTASWWSPTASKFAEGDRLHVVFDPTHPSTNVPWPPPT